MIKEISPICEFEIEEEVSFHFAKITKEKKRKCKSNPRDKHRHVSSRIFKKVLVKQVYGTRNGTIRFSVSDSIFLFIADHDPLFPATLSCLSLYI